MCWSIRSLYDALDGIDGLSDKMKELLADAVSMDDLMPQILEQMPKLIAVQEQMRTMMQTMVSTMSGSFGVLDDTTENTNTMGQAFDSAKDDDSFYLPPEVFQNADFQKAMSSFLSPDGKSARFIISQRVIPQRLRASPVSTRSSLRPAKRSKRLPCPAPRFISPVQHRHTRTFRMVPNTTF